MAVNVIPYPTAPQKRKNRPSDARKPRSNGGVGQSECNRCVICGKRLKGRQLVTCSASHRVTLSKLKRRSADEACQRAFGWTKGEGEALIQRHGLPRMEVVLGMAGWHWEPAQREWVKAKQEVA